MPPPGYRGYPRIALSHCKLANFPEDVMTLIDAKTNYDLVFQVHRDGSVTVESIHLSSSPKPMPWQHFDRNDNINIKVRGPDGTSLAMQSVEIDFKQIRAATLSPLYKADNPKFVWRPGQQHTHIVPAAGLWSYKAILTTSDKKQYFYPGATNLLPEFQVGDGSEARPINIG